MDVKGFVVADKHLSQRAQKSREQIESGLKIIVIKKSYDKTFTEAQKTNMETGRGLARVRTRSLA